jgi:Fe(3+) dicitrate transport protein
MKKSFFVCIWLCLFCQLHMWAQAGSLKGNVRDSSGKGMEAAAIQILQTHLGVVSNTQGDYNFPNLPPGKYIVAILLIGYKPQTHPVIIESGKSTTLDVVLEMDMQMLNPLVVNGIHVLSGIGHLGEQHDGIIYSGKKNEVLLTDSLDANTAQNNPRQVLGRVPGANYSETEGGGFPSSGIGFRGLNPTQSIEMNTRQNGYNVSADLYGYPESYYLPPLEAVERIEVVRGASSLQFGPQFGGVINYITRNAPADKKFEFTTEQTGGSYGFFNSFNAAGGTIGKWNYYTYLQAKTSDGWRANSAHKQMMGFAHLEYKASEKFKVGLEYSILRNQIRMPGGLSDTEFNANSRNSFRSRNWLTSPWNIIALTSSWNISPQTLITLKSALNISARKLVWKNEDGGPERADSISTITHTYVPREVQQESFLSSTTELRLLQSYLIKGQSQALAAGIRYFSGSMRRQGGGPGSTGSDFDLNLYGGNYGYDLNFLTTNAALFVENTFHAGSNLAITPGFRYEYLRSSASGYVTDTSSAIVNSNRTQTRYIPLAGLGLQYRTSVNSDVYANGSQAYRPTDYANQTPIGVASKIDPNLKDANGYNADLGWRGTWKNFMNFDLGGFCLVYNQRIGLVTLTDAQGNPYTYRTNVANSLHQGVETYLEVNLIRLFFKEKKALGLSFFNSFSYIDARYTSGIYKGNQVEEAPKTINRFGVTASYRKISTTFLISNTASAYGDANNTRSSPDATVGLIPAYQVMDWSATIHYKRYNLKFGMNNLSDAKYFTLRTDEYPGPGIIPSPGKSFYVGIGGKF